MSKKPGLSFNFNNTYINLPEGLYSLVNPTPVKQPKVAIFNRQLAAELGFNENYSDDDIAQILSGNILPKNAQALAQAYAGHQFGHFTMLGDGRAILLGEQIAPTGERFDIQLKGSGRTPYSRGGDGRATISSMLREYLMSEALHALGIPSTRSLAVVLTGEEVYRELALPGAILTRIASSHIRVGTFEYAARFLGQEKLKLLLDYTCQRHFPDLLEEEKRAEHFLRKVIEKQLDLIVDWLRVGFIHGVMNTDNMSIPGKTIDYGPCAFMNAYDPGTVFSSIDHQGRYAYMNQPAIGQWNIAVLATTLLPLIHADEKKATSIAQEILNTYPHLFRQKYLTMLRKKLGIRSEKVDDGAFIDELLTWMKKSGADYTNTFSYLTGRNIPDTDIYNDSEFKAWHIRWTERINSSENGITTAQKIMEIHNPIYIPRNHLVEEALEEATWKSDYRKFNQLLNVITHPYTYNFENKEFQSLPAAGDNEYLTYCGT